MTSPILFCGQEDLSFTPIGGSAFASSLTTGQFSVDTTAGHFRSGYSRYALSFQVINTTTNGINFIRSAQFTSSAFWTTVRLVNVQGGSPNSSAVTYMRWLDSSGIVRLLIRNKTGNAPPNGIWQVCTQNAAGTVTQIGSDVASFGGINSSPPDKIDVYINYAVSGSFIVYINGAQVFSYSGDVTTNGVTSLAYLDLGQLQSSGNSAALATSWSECIVSTSDTRNMSLVTQAPSAAGNTDTFTSGAFSNVNQNFAPTGQASPDYSKSAGQLQEYKVGQSIPAGSFSVISVVQAGQMTISSAGPQHIKFAVRTGGSDFLTTDLTVSTAWGLVTYNWDTNPNTSAAWQTTDLPSASTSFNLGYQSDT